MGMGDTPTRPPTVLETEEAQVLVQTGAKKQLRL